MQVDKYRDKTMSEIKELINKGEVTYEELFVWPFISDEKLLDVPMIKWEVAKR